MEKYAVDQNDLVESRANEMVKESNLGITEARIAAQKEIENGNSEMVELRPGENTGGNPG